MRMIFLALIAAATVAEAKTVEVKMLNNGKDGIMVFEPAFVKVDVGDTVKFVPTDAAHNSSSVYVPPGAKPWMGKTDQALSVKMTKEGVYLYKCDPHVVMAMIGVIQVGKATNLAEARAAGDKLAATISMNKERVKKYLDQAK